MDNPPELNTFTVKEGDHEMTVVIPKTGDKSYDDYLELVEREKTSNELKTKPPKPAPTISKEDIRLMGIELLEYKKRKKENVNRKYF